MFRIWNYAENCNLVEGQSSSEANFAKIKVNPRLLENSKKIGKTFNLIRYIFWCWPWKFGSCLKLANFDVLTKGGCVSLPVNQNLWIKNSISGQILGYRQYFWPFFARYWDMHEIKVHGKWYTNHLTLKMISPSNFTLLADSISSMKLPLPLSSWDWFH